MRDLGEMRADIEARRRRAGVEQDRVLARRLADDVPDLIAENERLRADRDHWRATAEEFPAIWKPSSLRENERLTAEVERLNAKLEDAYKTIRASVGID
jgi:hypothetical protein